MITELTHKFLQTKGNTVFILIKKGSLIYDIEYLLMYEMNMYYWNDNDPFQETKHCIGDVANYDMYYHIFSRVVDGKRLKLLREYYTHISEKINKIVIDGNLILRHYKLKELNLD